MQWLLDFSDLTKNKKKKKNKKFKFYIFDKLFIMETEERLIEKSQIRTQRVICPIDIGYFVIDSNYIDSNKKVFYIPWLREGILGIRAPNPEELIKPSYITWYQGLIILIVILLI